MRENYRNVPQMDWLSNKKKISPLEIGLLVLVTMGFLFGISQFRGNNTSARTLASTTLTKLMNPTLSRGLASGTTNLEPKSANADDKYLRSQSISCKNNETTIRTDAPFLRLNFFDCPFEKNKKDFLVEFRNQATGEKILLFSDEYERKITTNYFPLETGTNRLTMTIFLKKGFTISKNILAVRSSSN